MVFQDFDHIQERRRIERERKFRKRVTIVAVSAFVLVFLIAAGVFAVVTVSKDNSSDKKSDKPNEISQHARVIAMVCTATHYKNSCNETLTKAVQKSHSTAEPKDLLKYAISAASNAVGDVSEKINSMKFDDPKEQKAWEYCQTLAGQAKGEFNRSLNGVVLTESFEMKNLTNKAGDLKTWLSAVISYSEMCADAFSEGQKRSDMEKIWTTTRQLTDNSLALIQQLTSYISSMEENNFQPSKRRLLQQTQGHYVDDVDFDHDTWINDDDTTSSGRRLLQETNGHYVDEEGLPVWITKDDRRMLAQGHRPTPNSVVAKDGSGNYKTISEAINAVPQNHNGRYIIYVKSGVYDEKVVIPYGLSDLTMYGDGSQKTIITGNKSVKDGLLLTQTATIQILGSGFMAQSIGFRNTAGPSREQAVAAQVQGDRAIFVNCRFEGYQDTLWAATHRQFYKKCMILGTIDFIFGDAAAVFQKCLLQVRKPGEGQHNVITASGRIERHEATGIVIQNSRIVADPALESAKNSVKSYLSRPWKDQGRSIIMETQIGDFIAPEGYVPYRGTKGIDTVFFAEYNNKGPGASTDKRVKWAGVKIVSNKNSIWSFTVKPFIQGDWITKLGIEVQLGFFSS